MKNDSTSARISKSRQNDSNEILATSVSVDKIVNWPQNRPQRWTANFLHALNGHRPLGRLRCVQKQKVDCGDANLRRQELIFSSCRDLPDLEDFLRMREKNNVIWSNFFASVRIYLWRFKIPCKYYQICHLQRKSAKLDERFKPSLKFNIGVTCS